jgi:hypothetical protein
VLRCRVVGTVGAAVHSSDGEDEFGKGVRDPMPRIDVGGQFVVTAMEVLHKRMPGTDHPCRAQPFRPRMGRSRDFRGPWSSDSGGRIAAPTASSYPITRVSVELTFVLCC